MWYLKSSSLLLLLLDNYDFGHSFWNILCILKCNKYQTTLIRTKVFVLKKENIIVWYGRTMLMDKFKVYTIICSQYIRLVKSFESDYLQFCSSGSSQLRCNLISRLRHELMLIKGSFHVFPFTKFERRVI